MIGKKAGKTQRMREGGERRWLLERRGNEGRNKAEISPSEII